MINKERVDRICSDNNLLFSVAESGRMEKFWKFLTLTQRQGAIATIIEEMAGRCMTTLEGELEEFGITEQMVIDAFPERDKFGNDADMQLDILFDSLIEECPACGWWVPAGEQDNCSNDDDYCPECGENWEDCMCNDDEDEEDEEDDD